MPFTPDNLAMALSNELTSPVKVSEKKQFNYLLEYLGDVGDSLNAKTIIIEHDYISKSYLNDYSNFYSTCFGKYERFCKRVHFFSNEFTEHSFIAALKKASSRKSPIWKNYLGYIVVKPLPLLTIGATLLKTYELTPTHKRYFPSSKEYKVNLFGKELKVNSLAFQEQDSVVGACASSALWSAFQKTSQLFQTPLPSPSDITKSAKNSFQSSGRIYPNGGLDHYQIGNAIESVGLVSELRNSKKFKAAGIGFIKSFIYAYNRMGLPVLMGIEFPEGGHLITVTGYKEEENLSFSRTDEIALKASKIERFYAHDDQVGPFSRLSFDPSGDIITGWPTQDSSGPKTKTAKFVSLFIPLYNKIRLTFENIYFKTRLVDFYFQQRFEKLPVYWDIYLSFSNDYKENIFKSPTIPSQQRYLLLTKPLPKYIWIAKALVDDECVMELIFDATQIATSESCIRVTIFNDSLRSILTTDLQNQSIIDHFSNELSPRFLKMLNKSVEG